MALTRAVVSVATTPHTRRGQARLKEQGVSGFFFERLPDGCPPHEQVPYAFKSYALKEVAVLGIDLLLWCDACMLPVRSLEPLWQRIEKEGAVIVRNGFTNYEWTADSAYDDLFKPEITLEPYMTIGDLRHRNREIPHVIAGCFGLNVRHPVGKAILDEYYRLASETKAFCGPWDGPVGVKHRHDQTALSVLAWRNGVKLAECPDVLIYGKAETATDERTLLVADGDY